MGNSNNCYKLSCTMGICIRTVSYTHLEIIVAIIVVGCIIYMFKGDFARKNVGVTVLESLPLSIFKKWGKMCIRDSYYSNSMFFS